MTRIPQDTPYKPYHTIAYGKSVHGKLYTVRDMEYLFYLINGITYEEFVEREKWKDEVRQRKKEEKRELRKRSLETRLKKIGLKFDEENTEHMSYVERGTPSMKSIIAEEILGQ